MRLLLKVETEANGDLGSTNERDPSLVDPFARLAGTRDFYPVLAALSQPSIISHRTL